MTDSPNAQTPTPDNLGSVSAAEFAALLPPDVVATMPGMTIKSDPDEPPTLAGAAFRQWNFVGSTLASNWLSERLFPADPTPIDTEGIIELLDRDQMWGLEQHFLEVHTVGQYNAIKRDIQQEQADRERLAEASLVETIPMGLLAGLADITSVIPFGYVAKSVKAGASVMRAAAGTALAAGSATALTELGLQGTQQLRTANESFANVAGATILGGVIGAGGMAISNAGGVSRMATRAKDAATRWLDGPDYNQRLVQEAQELWDAANTVIAERVAQGRKPTKKMLAEKEKAFDALEAAEERLTLYNDLQMASAGPLEWARTVIPRVAGKFSERWLDPIHETFTKSQSVVARQAVEQMVEIPVLLNKNLRGEATAIAATTEIDPFIGAWATFRDKMLGGSLKEEAQRKAGFGDSFYAQARKAGFQGNWREFDSAVDIAVRNGFVDPKGNAGVTTAAKAMRELILDPVVNEARAAGVELPDNPFGALGYVPRKYKVKEVLGPDGQGRAFKDTVARYQFDRLLEEAKAKGEPLTPQKVSGLRRSAKSFANEAFKSITNGRIDEEGSFHKAFLSGGSPFAQRVVPVPDIVLAQNGWIETSATALMEIYLRQTIPTIMLAKRFKTATGKADPALENSVVPALVKEYDQLGSVAKSAEEREAINAEGQRQIAMVRNLRDALLHADRFTPRTRKHEALTNAIQLTKLYQVTRLMGNIGLASLPDLANVILRAGPGRFVKSVGQSMMKAAKFEGLSGQEVADQAKRLGAAIEWATNASVAANADLMSPLAGVSTPVSRFVAKTARVYSISNFSVAWNDTMRRAVYRTSVDRVLEASERGWDALPQAEQIFLAHLGLDKTGVERIGVAWRSQSGDLHDGFLRWASLTDWNDQEAVRLMSAALNKDVASTIIRPRAGDKALGFSGPLAQLVFQFQGFLMSHALRTLTLSEQRLLANGAFSQDALRVYAGVGSMIGLGWLAELLYAIARDAALPPEEKKNVARLTQNPGQHLARAVDRSAVTGLFGQANAFWERFGGVGMTRVAQKAFEDESLAIEARGRWMDRDPLQTLMGPTLSQTADVIKFGVSLNKNLVDDKDFTKRDARTLREASPFQNHILLRGIFEEAERRLGEDILGVAYDR